VSSPASKVARPIQQSRGSAVGRTHLSAGEHPSTQLSLETVTKLAGATAVVAPAVGVVIRMIDLSTAFPDVPLELAWSAPIPQLVVLAIASAVPWIAINLAFAAVWTWLPHSSELGTKVRIGLTAAFFAATVTWVPILIVSELLIANLVVLPLLHRLRRRAPRLTFSDLTPAWEIALLLTIATRGSARRDWRGAIWSSYVSAESHPNRRVRTIYEAR
jgi:hypothetical protein